MSATTLEYHYETIGYVLEHLVSTGLRKVDLEASDAMEVMIHRMGNEEEVLATFNDVLHWMIDEGIVRASSIQAFDSCDIFNGVQLTSKGIGVLQLKPEGESTIAEELSKGERGSLGSDAYGKIGSFVGGVLGGFSQSFG